jgi:hypothetical protein
MISPISRRAAPARGGFRLGGGCGLCRLLPGSTLVGVGGCGLRSRLAADTSTLAQGLQQIARFRCDRRFLLRQRTTLDLGFHEFGDGGLVAIVECAGVEASFLGADNVLGQFQHLALDLEVGQFLEGLSR